MIDASLIQLQPRGDTIYISMGRTVMVTGLDGSVSEDSHQGLWIYQSRPMSKYRWLVNGCAPQLSAFSAVQQNSSLAYYIAAPKNWKKTGAKNPDPAQQSIELCISRRVGNGMHEDIVVTNHTQVTTAVDLTLEIASDFIGPSDDPSKGTPVGKVAEHWRKLGSTAWELTFDYQAKHAFHHQQEKGVARLHRCVTLKLHCEVKPKYRNGKIQFRIKLPPHEQWRQRLEWVPQIDEHDAAVSARVSPYSPRKQDQKREQFLTEATQLSSPGAPTFPALVISTLERSKKDLAALRLFDLDGHDKAGETWIPAAGLPTYLGLFGRDSLASGWQAALLSTAMMRGALAELSKTQGREINDWRDEQPGRFVHELHTDPHAVLNFNPHGRYYGGVTGAIYYPIVVSTLWHWTGDKQLVRRFIDPALKGLAWAEKYSLDDSGFYRYRARSTQGEHNQGWKYSDDAIVYPDGSQVKDPLGTCEMQAFVYASKLHLSEVLWWLGDRDLASRFFREAEELKKRFNDFFWIEQEGYFGMAIDPRGRLVRSVASDPGHCLAAGIVDRSLAARVAERLLGRDLFSGWGVRTLSADHPAFNPFSYHRGSVWPVENAVFVLAFARYGLHDMAQMLARAMFESASIFKYRRLPEVFAGHTRDDEHPFPGMYPKANWPQAWSASAPLTVMQALLGIYPYAPLNTLLLDPWLPEWLPEFTVEQLRIGNAVVSFRFKRNEEGRTDYEITDLRGTLHVIRQPSPWSLTAGFGERVRDAIASLLPVKLAS